MYKIIDNFLPEKDFNHLKHIMESGQFPWFKQSHVAFFEKPKKSHWYFTHMFLIDKEGPSDFYRIIDEVFIQTKKIQGMLIRVKGNLYPKNDIIVEHDWHTDYPFKHNGAIFYLNNNNGHTILEDGTKIESIENRMLFFDPSKKHKSTNCTDTMYRININFNYMAMDY